jgi:hypothetical protein
LVRIGLLSAALGLTAAKSAAAAQSPQVETLAATPLGTKAMSVNGRIQPHGLPATYHFEYGTTAAYGKKTDAVQLPPRLAAYYHETWDHGPSGWESWGGGPQRGFEHHPDGGARGGFVRYTGKSGNDHNHDDGIGTLHLVKYLYPGPVRPADSVYLAAGDPDLRDARISLSVRGVNWVPRGSELVWWTQSQSDMEKYAGETGPWKRANWAYTGYSLTDQLASGKWDKVEYRLRNHTADWSFGGNNLKQGPSAARYSYWSIDQSQRHLNVDFFHMLVYVNPAEPPTGQIDFDEFEIAYRNYSLLLPSNGGRLVSSPPSSEPASSLTDGWRHGSGRMWHSAANPSSPQEFVYSLEKPVTVQAVQLHQHTEWPAREVEVLVSQDGQAYSPLLKKALPERHPHGPNHAFTVDHRLNAAARHVKVRILSGYRADHWGLGEIEIFGDGAEMQTDDDWYFVNTDIESLEPGSTYHYRLVATNRAGTIHGPDQTFTIPADTRPHLHTGSASRITATTATLDGRLDPMGIPTHFHFEYGVDAAYGSKTPAIYAGLQNTPRTVIANLTGLKPNTAYHFRLVGVNETGTSVGGDQTFRTKKD